MVSATVTLTTGAQSIKDLIEDTTPGQFLLDPRYAGLSGVPDQPRYAELQMQITSAGDTAYLVFTDDTPVTATDAGFVFKSTDTETTGAFSRCVIRLATNQLDLSQMFLIGGAGGETIAILANAV